MFVKYTLFFLASISWKFTMYAPNSMGGLDPKTKAPIKPEKIQHLVLKNRKTVPGSTSFASTMAAG